MKQRSLFPDLPANTDATGDMHRWEIRADTEVLLSGVISGRLRAGIVLGVRLCRDANLRDAVAWRILARLGSRL